jgi:hypothetical protein
VRATVRLARRLASDGGYQVEEDKIAGARTLTIIGHGEAWVMWPSQTHVVKVGGRGRSDVPAAMVATYVDRYPSQLPGGVLEGALPPGPDETPRPAAPAEKYDPANPHPEIEHYDPNKVKLPDATDSDPANAGSDAQPAAQPGDGSAAPAKPADATTKKRRKAKSK